MKSKQSLKMSDQKVRNERDYSILGVNKKYIQKVGYKFSLNYTLWENWAYTGG
jgi:hypothetical protein